MQNHTSVPTKKILYGTINGLINFGVLFNTSGIAAGVLLCTIQASVAKPVLLETMVQVITAFNAVTTNVLTLGSDAASANQFLAAADITEGTPGFYPTGAGIGKAVLTANTDVYVKYTQSGTAATTGAAKVFLKMTVLDPDAQPQLTA